MQIASMEAALRAERARGEGAVTETSVFVRRLEETIARLRSELAALQSQVCVLDSFTVICHLYHLYHCAN